MTLCVSKLLKAGKSSCHAPQANDIAIQLARAYTGNYDVIIFEESFHGGLSIGADMSAKVNILLQFVLYFSWFYEVAKISHKVIENI